MNDTDVTGKTLLQRMLDYRNRAEQLRILARNMVPATQGTLHAVASTYDQLADNAHAILMQSAEQES